MFHNFHFIVSIACLINAATALAEEPIITDSRIYHLRNIPYSQTTKAATVAELIGNDVKFNRIIYFNRQTFLNLEESSKASPEDWLRMILNSGSLRNEGFGGPVWSEGFEAAMIAMVEFRDGKVGVLSADRGHVGFVQFEKTKMNFGGRIPDLRD